MPGGRHQIGIPAGFNSESVAGFLSECLAGFLGIRTDVPFLSAARSREWSTKGGELPS
jgi:hypothetical protein